jgi:glycine betaine/proline transport system ATP-binding protein
VDAHLCDLIALSAGSPKALAVVDEEHRVVGVLARVTLLQALGQSAAASPGGEQLVQTDAALNGAARSEVGAS